MTYVPTTDTYSAADRKADEQWVRDHKAPTAESLHLHADSHTQSMESAH